MDKLVDVLVLIIIIVFSISLILSLCGYYIEEQNKKMLEEVEHLIKRTNDSSMTYVNDYYESNKLRMNEIEKTLLAEIACLATKNNNDIKEIKDKITTGKKNKRISQLVDENNKLKEENEKLKEENKKLKEKNNTRFYVPSYVPYNYNPYAGVINNMCCSLNNQNKYEW